MAVDQPDKKSFIRVIGVAAVITAACLAYLAYAEFQASQFRDLGWHGNSNWSAATNTNAGTVVPQEPDAPFPCGSPDDAATEEAGIEAPSGWQNQRLPYLCLVIAHPAGWRFVFARSYPVSDVQPLTVMVPAKDSLDLIPASIFPVAKDAQIVEAGMTVTDIRQKYANIGGSATEFSTLGMEVVNEQGASWERGNYLLYSPAKQRAYLVKANFFLGEITPSGADVKSNVEKMMLTARAY